MRRRAVDVGLKKDKASDRPGAPLKRPASYVSSNDGPLLSEAAVAELEATRNINDFRKRAGELGFRTQHRNSDGRSRDHSRADILEACRRRLKVQERDAMRRRVVDIGVRRSVSRAVSSLAPVARVDSSGDDRLV